MPRASVRKSNLPGPYTTKHTTKHDDLTKSNTGNPPVRANKSAQLGSSLDEDYLLQQICISTRQEFTSQDSDFSCPSQTYSNSMLLSQSQPLEKPLSADMDMNLSFTFHNSQHSQDLEAPRTSVSQQSFQLTESSQVQERALLNMPIELVCHVCEFLGLEDLERLARTCSGTWNLVLDNLDTYCSKLIATADPFNVVSNRYWLELPEQQIVLGRPIGSRIWKHVTTNFFYSSHKRQDWEKQGFEYVMGRRGWFRTLRGLLSNRCTLCGDYTFQFLCGVGARVCIKCMSEESGHVCCPGCEHSSERDQPYPIVATGSGQLQPPIVPFEKDKTGMFTTSSFERQTCDFDADLAQALAYNRKEHHGDESDDDDYSHEQSLRDSDTRGKRIGARPSLPATRAMDVVNVYEPALKHAFALIPIETVLDKYPLDIKDVHRLPKVTVGVETFVFMRAAYELAFLQHNDLASALRKCQRRLTIPSVTDLPISDDHVLEPESMELLVTPKDREIARLKRIIAEQQAVIRKMVQGKDVIGRGVALIAGKSDSKAAVPRPSMLLGDVHVPHASSISFSKSRHIDMLLGYIIAPNKWTWSCRPSAIVIANSDDLDNLGLIYPGVPFYRCLNDAITNVKNGSTIALLRGYKLHGTTRAVELWKSLRLVGETSQQWVWRNLTCSAANLIIKSQASVGSLIVEVDLPSQPQAIICEQTGRVQVTVPPEPHIHIDNNAGLIVEAPCSLENLIITSGAHVHGPPIFPVNLLFFKDDIDRYRYCNFDGPLDRQLDPDFSKTQKVTDQRLHWCEELFRVVQYCDPIRHGDYCSALTMDSLCRMDNCVIFSRKGSSAVARTPLTKLILTNNVFAKARSAGLVLTRGASLVDNKMSGNIFYDNTTFGLHTDFKVRTALLQELEARNKFIGNRAGRVE
jgi:hypothetical protein